MLRAASWTAGLFAVGSAICHFIPGSCVEPLVLMALGSALLLLSSRGSRSHVRTPAQAREAA
jgi:hypothetical protein